MKVDQHIWLPRLFFGTMLVAAFALPISASARQQSSRKSQDTDAVATQSQPAQSQPGQTNPAGENQEEGTSPKNDRLFGVLPNYLTVENQATVSPLTSGGKFKLVAKNAFDPVIFPFIGFIALVNQGQNSDPGFGQGAAGFGKRYGAAFGDSTIGSFMTGAIFPSIFKQDPRYYQLVHGDSGGARCTRSRGSSSRAPIQGAASSIVPSW